MPAKSKDIATRSQTTTGLPVPMPVQLDREVRALVTKLDPPLEAGRANYELAASDAPSPAMRSLLDGRRAALDAWLAPGGPGVVADELGKLIDAGMAMRSGEPGAARRWAAIAAQDLMDLPAFAIIGACQDIRRGNVGDGKWLPETGVIRTVAQRRVHALARERREIEAVLSAEVRSTSPNPERRERLAQVAHDLALRMRQGAEAEKRARMTPQQIRDAAELDAAVRENRPDRRPMPKLSLYLREKYGLDPAPADRFLDDDRAAS